MGKFNFYSVKTYFVLAIAFGLLGSESKIFAYQIGLYYEPSLHLAPQDNWMYGTLKSVSAGRPAGQCDLGAWSDANQFTHGQRVCRVYSERQPWFDGKGSWFNFWDSTRVNSKNETGAQAQVTQMKNSGIDFIVFDATWSLDENTAKGTSQGAAQPGSGVPYNHWNDDPRTALKNATLPELDAFISANQNRDASQVVQFTVSFGGDNMQFLNWGKKLVKRSPKSYPQVNPKLSASFNPDADLTHNSQYYSVISSHYRDIFKAKIQYVIDRYCGTANAPKMMDRKGNRLYRFKNNMPVIDLLNTGEELRSLRAHLKIEMSELTKLGNQVAQAAGYPGVYWEDVSQTIATASTPLNAVSGSSMQEYSNYLDALVGAGFNAENTLLYRAIDGQNFPGYKAWIDGYGQIWNAMINEAKRHPGFKYHVPVTPGYDPRALGEGSARDEQQISRSCDGAFDSAHNSDPVTSTSGPYGCSRTSTNGYLFSNMLQKAKAEIDQNQDTTDQTLFVTSWNDLQEGHYIMPTVGDQGAHAAAVKNVFKPSGVDLASGLLVGAFNKILNTAQIHYGANGKFITKSFVTGTSVQCSNANFGGDPAPYVAKVCYDANGVALAHENQSFALAVPAPSRTVTSVAMVSVKYGGNGKFVTKSFPSGTTVPCSNASFGDPAPYFAKACYSSSGVLMGAEGASIKLYAD